MAEKELPAIPTLPATDTPATPKVQFVGDPWDRQPTEGIKPYKAFVCYLNMGPKRSAAKVGRELSKSTALINRWSSAHKWIRRVEAYEDNAEREYQAEVASARREMARRQVASATRFQEVALAALKAKFGPELKGINAKSLKSGEILKFFVDAAKVERAVLGISDTGDGEETIQPQMMSDGDRKPTTPITFTGRIEGALDLLETARARAANGTAEQPDR